MATIIMVENSALLRERLKEMLDEFPKLEMRGEYDNAAAAISAFRREPADIVLLDIKLNGSVGLDVLRHVKGTHPATKVIVFTNHSDDEFRALYSRFGADYFFSKTHETKCLHETLKMLNVDAA